MGIDWRSIEEGREGSDERGEPGRRELCDFEGFFVGGVEELGFDVEGLSHLLFDAGKAAGDVAFGMAKDVADSVEWPAGVLPESQHGEVSPFAFIRMGKVVVDQLPELIRS